MSRADAVGSGGAWIGVVLLGLVLAAALLATGVARADDSFEVGPRLEVSRDGEHWHEHLDRALLDGSVRWVPGDRRRTHFLVRHVDGELVGLDVRLRRAGAGRLVATERVRVAARRTVMRADGTVLRTGRWRALTPGQRIRMVEVVGKGRVVRVQLRAHLPFAAGNRTMDQRGRIRIHVRTARPGAVAFEPLSASASTPGSIALLPWAWAVGLLGVSVGGVAAGARRRTAVGTRAHDG